MWLKIVGIFGGYIVVMAVVCRMFWNALEPLDEAERFPRDLTYDNGGFSNAGEDGYGDEPYTR